jgi:hypothetical protein
MDPEPQARERRRGRPTGARSRPSLAGLPLPAAAAALAEDRRRRAQRGLTAGPYAKWLLGLWPAPLLLLSLAGLRFGVGIEAAAFARVAAGCVQLPRARFLLVLLPALAVLRRSGGPPARHLALGAASLALEAPAWLWVRDAREFSRRSTVASRRTWTRVAGSARTPRRASRSSIASPTSRSREAAYVFIPEAPYDSLVVGVRTRVHGWWWTRGEAEVFRQQLRRCSRRRVPRREQRLELVYVGGRVVGYGVGIFRVLQPGEARSGRSPALEAKWLRPQ